MFRGNSITVEHVSISRGPRGLVISASCLGIACPITGAHVCILTIFCWADSQAVSIFPFHNCGAGFGQGGEVGSTQPNAIWCWVRTTFLWWWQTAPLAWVTTLQSPVNSGRLLWKLVGMEDSGGGDSSWSTAWQLLTTSAFGVPSTRGWKETRVFFFKVFNCSRVDLQWGVSFRCTAKWFSWAYTYIYSFSDSFPIQVIAECWAEFPIQYSRFLLAFILYMKVRWKC